MALVIFVLPIYFTLADAQNVVPRAAPLSATLVQGYKILPIALGEIALVK